MADKDAPQREFTYTVRKDDANFSGNTTVLILNVPVKSEKDLGRAITFLNSFELKKEVESRKHEWGLANYGMSVSGGHETVDANGKRPSKADDVVAIERRLKFTRNI